MLLTKVVSAVALGAAWIPAAVGDAEFEQVRIKNLNDYSNRPTDPPQKYFHEATFSAHYDGRFARHALPYVEQKKTLKFLVQTYLATLGDLQVETWLMHGSLLGWWWGQKILPWDNDVDVQVSEASMYFLAAYHNMSTYHYKTPGDKGGRDYLLEVNPHYVNREQTDTLNKIDARWIDMQSGMFIDITTVRYNLTHPEGEGMLSCKDGHEFRDTYLFPLLDTEYEGVPVKIPYKYQDMLEAEYGKDALSNTEYRKHIFSDETMKWEPRSVDEEGNVY